MPESSMKNPKPVPKASKAPKVVTVTCPEGRVRKFAEYLLSKSKEAKALRWRQLNSKQRDILENAINAFSITFFAALDGESSSTTVQGLASLVGPESAGADIWSDIKNMALSKTGDAIGTALKVEKEQTLYLLKLASLARRCQYGVGTRFRTRRSEADRRARL